MKVNLKSKHASNPKVMEKVASDLNASAYKLGRLAGYVPNQVKRITMKLEKLNENLQAAELEVKDASPAKKKKLAEKIKAYKAYAKEADKDLKDMLAMLDTLQKVFANKVAFKKLDAFYDEKFSSSYDDD